jgi:hypothetical protein
MEIWHWGLENNYIIFVWCTIYFLFAWKFCVVLSFFICLHLCCLKRTCTFNNSSHFASNSMQVWWSTWPYRVFVLFSSIVKMLYCYPKKVNVLCLSSLFYINNIFKLHLWQYGVFLNATTITTWIDLYELGCIQGLLAMVYFCFFLLRKIYNRGNKKGGQWWINDLLLKCVWVQAV